MEKINGRTPEKILFNIRECAYGACLSECPYDGSDDCMEELLNDALALIRHLEAEREAALAYMKGSRICVLCAHWEVGINEPCMHCTFENNCFEWRGIKPPKEDAHDA